MSLPPFLSGLVLIASRISRFAVVYLKRSFGSGGYAAPDIPAMSIEPTNVCNAKCVFCANPFMTRRKESLSMDQFRKAVDEYADMGGTQIDFNVTIGDPLLDKQLLEKARYVKKFPQFKTNGFVTSLQWLHLYDLNEFYDSGITWMSVSTVLSGRESYKKFFGVDLYDRMLQNLSTILRENLTRKSMAIMVDIKPTDEIPELVLQHPDFQMIQGLTGQNLEKLVRQRSFYADDWIGAVKLPSYLKKRPLYPRRHRPCQLLYKGLMIYSNGNVGACSCRDFEASSELILGNVARDKLSDLWKGEKLAGIRSAWRTKNKVPKICQSCRHYLY